MDNAEKVESVEPFDRANFRNMQYRKPFSKNIFVLYKKSKNTKKHFLILNTYYIVKYTTELEYPDK